MWWPSGVTYLSVVWFWSRGSWIQAPAHTTKIFKIWKLIDDWSLIYTNERIIIIFIRYRIHLLGYVDYRLGFFFYESNKAKNTVVKSTICCKFATFLSIVCIECQIFQLTCCSDVTSSLLLSSVTEIGWLERSLSLGRWPVSTSRPWKFAAIEMHWSAFRLHLSVLSQYTSR